MGKLFVEKANTFAKKEAVFIISFCAAVITFLFVSPSMTTLNYIDLRVLCILFCLMAVIAGFQQCGLFIFIAQKLLSGRHNFRVLCSALVMLPFFASMLITNDVALIAFVPFTVLVLGMIGKSDKMIYVVVLQTIAANLGSMATPVGNPQNLFLYSKFDISISSFFITMLPFILLSFFLLMISTYAVKNEIMEVNFEKKITVDKPRMFLFLGLFSLCLLSVFHLLHYGILIIIVLLALFVMAREIFKLVDYGLLFTFVCFFIFAGNIGEIGPIRNFLAEQMAHSGVITSVISSQVISNVPSAVLLSNFTDNFYALLIGTNIGGLGTLIASLASLISYKIYLTINDAKPLRYLCVFTLMNFTVLFLLIVFYKIII